MNYVIILLEELNMAHLQVRDMDDKLYSSLRELATNEKRSISQEVIYIIQKYLSTPKSFYFNPTD
jgi:plasmid stability protein